jgi:murein DD-endopeptidase MepM/ murein hydrolase activator NlpD
VQKVTRHGACGKGVIVRDAHGFTYTYCHGSRLLVGKGKRVKEGDAILLSGSTGNSTGPHLHLQIQRASGKLVCPQPLLKAWKKGHPASPAHDRETECYFGAKKHHRSKGHRRKASK